MQHEKLWVARACVEGVDYLIDRVLPPICRISCQARIKRIVISSCHARAISDGAAHVVILQEDVLLPRRCVREIHPCRVVELCLVHTPLLNAASQYPWSAFHESRMPSLSVFLTVVLTIIAPQETHPCMLEAGMTCVVTELESSIIGFEGFWLELLNIHVGLSQVPYQPGNAGSFFP